MLRKKMYTWFFVCFSIQGRQKRITTFTGVRPLPPPPPPPPSSSPFPSPPVFIHSSSSLPLALTSSPLHAQDGQTRGSSDQSRLALK